jgi:Holliday junction resolvase-like predicted endonuclease
MLRLGKLADFDTRLHLTASRELLTAARSQKLLTRARAQQRDEAAQILATHAERILEPEPASEFRRYAMLSKQISNAREPLAAALQSVLTRLPKLSFDQLVDVAEQSLDRILTVDAAAFPQMDKVVRPSENERRLHAHSGYANDVLFALARTLNEASRTAVQRDLQRPDAIPKARPIFLEAARLASRINSLDYVLDCVSFGEFAVAEFNAPTMHFRMDFADARLSRIRLLAIRRRMIHLRTGHREPRFVRERLKDVIPKLPLAFLDRHLEATGAPIPTEDELEKFERDATKLLDDLDAEDDLLLTAAGDNLRPSMLYHMSAALRWSTMAADVVAAKLPGKARRAFKKRVHLADLLMGLGDGDQIPVAKEACNDLTITLPTESHIDLVRKPFVRTGEGTVRAALSLGGPWALVVRESVNQGGNVGKIYGRRWEDYFAWRLRNTDWEVLGRNLAVADKRERLTEVDLLMLREDLLLVVEIKALTGSGITQYDHWKNRMIIEKGCAQASLAARYIDDHPQWLQSIAGKATASRVRHVQPLVMTTENMFDGWEFAGVPVAGETTRKAITEGSKVEYYDSVTREVQQVDWHIRPGDRNTQTILAALRNPIELKLAPEQGIVAYHRLDIAGLRLDVPHFVPDPLEASSEASTAKD